MVEAVIGNDGFGMLQIFKCAFQLMSGFICLLALFINRHHVHKSIDISSCFKSTRSYKACELNNLNL